MKVLRGITLSIPILILLWSGLAQPASFTIRKVAATGENSPQGGTFTQFDPVANTGAILFDALVKKDEPFRGIYVARGSTLSQWP